MAEQRLIDANVLLKYMSDMEVQTGKKCCTQAVKSCIEEFFPQVVFDQPTIDPETLQIVQQLRNKIKNLNAGIENLSKIIKNAYEERDDFKEKLESVTAELDGYKIFFNYVTACGDCNDISAIKAAEGIDFARQAHIPRDQWQDAADVME